MLDRTQTAVVGHDSDIDETTMRYSTNDLLMSETKIATHGLQQCFICETKDATLRPKHVTMFTLNLCTKR